MAEPLEKRAFDAVCSALAKIDRKLAARDLLPDTSVIDDLGLDSIRFVDLTVGIEEALQISEFPMQEWYDLEIKRDGKRFTIASLVAVGVSCMAARDRQRT